MKKSTASLPRGPLESNRTRPYKPLSRQGRRQYCFGVRSGSIRRRGPVSAPHGDSGVLQLS